MSTRLFSVFATSTCGKERRLQEQVTLGADEYEGTVGPSNKMVGPGTNLLWTADANSDGDSGWVICAREAAACAELPAAPANGAVGTSNSRTRQKRTQLKDGIATEAT